MFRPSLPRRPGGLRPAILSDRRGATIVEFALVAAPFLALLLAILQTSLAYLAQEALESAVEVAARGIVTGQAQAADLAGSGQGLSKAQLAERFRTKACKSLPGFLSCSRLYVDIQSADAGTTLATGALPLTFDASGGLSTPLSYNLGSQGSLVIVRLIYLWPMQIAPAADLSSLTGGKPTVLIATSVSKTEAYL